MINGHVVQIKLFVVALEYTTTTTADGPAGGQHACMYNLWEDIT